MPTLIEQPTIRVGAQYNWSTHGIDLFMYVQRGEKYFQLVPEAMDPESPRRQDGWSYKELDHASIDPPSLCIPLPLADAVAQALARELTGLVSGAPPTADAINAALLQGRVDAMEAHLFDMRRLAFQKVPPMGVDAVAEVKS